MKMAEKMSQKEIDHTLAEMKELCPGGHRLLSTQCKLTVCTQQCVGALPEDQRELAKADLIKQR